MADGVYSARDQWALRRQPGGPCDRKAVDVTTHLRARAVQAGAFLALVGGVIIAAPMTALADAPQVSISSLSSGDIPSGGTTTLKFKVTNRNKPTDTEAADPSVTVVVNSDGLSCSGDCNFNDTVLPGQTSREHSATLTAGSVDAGENKNAQISIEATIGGD